MSRPEIKNDWSGHLLLALRTLTILDRVHAFEPLLPSLAYSQCYQDYFAMLPIPLLKEAYSSLREFDHAPLPCGHNTLCHILGIKTFQHLLFRIKLLL